tara:strand:+ start:146 stop:451 length:306 start_codon:yes stop_codon:yes gene_type:complete
MENFLDKINHILTKDFLSNAKKIVDNPNNLSENIITYLKKNNIDLSKIIDNVENQEPINYDPTNEGIKNKESDGNDYDNLLLRLNNIQNIMADIKKSLKDS